MKTVNIRNATAADLPGILEIYNDALINTTAIYLDEPFTMESRKAWFDERLQGKWPLFVAEIEGRVAGFSSYGPFHERWGYRFTVENSIYIHQDFRGMGIGRQLMETLIRQAKRDGKHAMMASIDSEITASIKLHEALGFTEVGCFKEIGYKFGRWLSVRYFELTLDAGA